MSIQRKLLILLVTISMVPAITIGTVIFSSMQSLVTKNLVRGRTFEINQMSAKAKTFVNEMRILPLILGNVSSVQGIIRSSSTGIDDESGVSSNQWKGYLQSLFHSLVERDPRLFQLRYLDENGMEVVKVIKLDGKVIDNDELEDKSQSPFFQETSKLGIGEVYISPIDLSREDGIIREPHVPTMRFATPVFDRRNGERKGIVVANMMITNFLDQTRSMVDAENIMVDQDGFYLIHPDRSKEFSRELNNPYNYFNENSKFAEIIRKNSEKSYYETSTKEYKIWDRFYFDENDPDRYWIFLASSDADILLQPIKKMQFILIQMMLVALIIVVVISIFLSRSITRPIQHLYEGAKRIGDGDLTQPLPPVHPRAKDEIAQLTRIFDRMRLSLKSTIEEIKSTNVRELKVVNEELQQFAYVVSHDLKVPLRGIASLAQWIVEDCTAQLDAENVERLHLMIERVKKLEVLIEGILKYSRIGRSEEMIGPVNLNITVLEVINTISLPNPGPITVPDPLPTVFAEKTQMYQLFQNLIGNALRYIDTQTGRITITSKPEGNHVILRVSDNGIGIDPKYHEKVFGMFQVLEKTKGSPNTGIGLALVKRIIEKHKGKIWIESTPGQGTSFLFTLPVFKG